MKIKFLKSLVLGNRVRCGLGLLAFLFSIWFALIPGAAQSKNHKHITSLHVGEAAEGSRVTIVSDAALSDYEAFRRGDRFYVRIPLADYKAGQPGFRGEGFEDVQIQKVGDSIVISFRLQPGATARVDQSANRIGVIFSAPGRMTRSNRTYAGSNRGSYIPTDGIVRVKNLQALQRRDRDAAGPLPPGSPAMSQPTRERLVTERERGSQTPRGPRATTNRREDISRSGYNGPDANLPTSRSEAGRTTKSETPSSVSKSGSSSSAPSSSVPKNELSPTASPSFSPNYPPTATSTAVPAVPSQSAVKPPALAGSDGKSLRDIAVQWVKANRQLSLLAGLLLLALLVVLALVLRRGKTVVNAKADEPSLAQPKQASDTAVAQSAANSAPPSTGTSNVVGETAAPAIATASSPAAVPVSSAKAEPKNAIQENQEHEKRPAQPAMARSAAASTPPNQAWVPSPSTSEDQEREVFEL